MDGNHKQVTRPPLHFYLYFLFYRVLIDPPIFVFISWGFFDVDQTHLIITQYLWQRLQEIKGLLESEKEHYTVYIHKLLGSEKELLT